jgi:hypothetical protein
MLPVSIDSPERAKLEEDMWTRMSKQRGELREFPTTPEMYKTFPLSELSVQDLKQVQDGASLLVFMVSIRSADDKKRLFELCGYINGPNELWNCNKHNWP